MLKDMSSNGQVYDADLADPADFLDKHDFQVREIKVRVLEFSSIGKF